MDSDEENVPPRAETVLRSVFAILLYLAAVACVIMFLSTEENGYSYVLVAVVGFVIAHYVHPRRIGGATEDSYDFVDICFSVIDATFEILKLPFRIISWIVGSD